MCHVRFCAQNLLDTFSLENETVVLYLQLYFFIVAGDFESTGGSEECAGFNQCQVSAQSQSDSLHLLFIRYIYYTSPEICLYKSNTLD